MWSRSSTQKRFQVPVNVHVDSVTKLGMVMCHHWLECHGKRLVCCLQVQGHSEGSCTQIIIMIIIIVIQGISIVLNHKLKVGAQCAHRKTQNELPI